MSRRYAELIEAGFSEADALRETTTVDCSVEPSRTKQSFAREADINFLMDRFMRTGELPAELADVGQRQPMFGDFSDGISFMEALERVRTAEDSFSALDAQVRDRFRNDPAEFIEFMAHERNREEAVRLGLIPDRRAQERRSERSRVEDLRAREIEAAERRGREAAKAPIGT